MNVWISWGLFGMAFVYNILDVWHTKLLLSFGAVEINPLMDYMIKNYGVDSLFGVKIFMFLFLAILLFSHQIKFKKRREHETE